MHAASSRLLSLCSDCIYLFLYAPLLVLMAFSFTPSEYSVRLEGFTWRWYQAVWQSQHIQEALLVSLTVSIPAVLIATVIGTMTALALYRARFPGRDLLQSLLYIPLIMPSLVIGIALLLFFVAPIALMWFLFSRRMRPRRRHKRRHHSRSVRSIKPRQWRRGPIPVRCPLCRRCSVIPRATRMPTAPILRAGRPPER